MREDFPNVSPYAYCAHDPINYTDPTGLYLNVSGATWQGRRSLPSAASSEVLDMRMFIEFQNASMLLMGQRHYQWLIHEFFKREVRVMISGMNYYDIYTSFSGGSSSIGGDGQKNKIIDNTFQALNHYLFGDGSPVELGEKTVDALLNNQNFIEKHNEIIAGDKKVLSGQFEIDMTQDIFHVGRTRVDYSISEKYNTVTYTLFVDDGFWDVDYIDEWGGKGRGVYKPDKMGPNLERFGGKPYYYIPVHVIYPLK